MNDEEVRELGALYALGALDEESARDLEAILDELPHDVRQEILGWREIVGLLPLSLEPVHVSPQVRQRLIEEIGSRAADRRPAVVVPFKGRRALSSPGLTYALIAVSIILAATSISLYIGKQRLESSFIALRGELDASNNQLIAERRRRDEILASATRMVSLSGNEAAPQATARLFWDTQRQEWVIYFFNLPPAPADRDYQLWYITTDQRKVSARVFRDDSTGRIELRLVLPHDIASGLAAAAVTLEPRGGSPQPTGKLVLSGAI